ncbi:MAG: hypothetical protein K2V38_09210 [Gemmataceae bacterium]|nr:hypothetical protein [Gemmataceae bacterium]
MATADDVFRLNPIVHELARQLFALVNQEAPSDDEWTNVFLDVRFDGKGGFSSKIRATLTSGKIISLLTPTELTHQLLSLESARPAGKDRWFGCVLTVTAAGECEMKMNYDPNCAEDPAFFES